MRFREMSSFILDLWKNNRVETPIVLLGRPGGGKTAIAREVASMMTDHVQGRTPSAGPAECEVWDLTSFLPEDLGGLPYREDGTTQYAPQSRLARLCKPGAYGILCLDDIPAASLGVQVAARQLLLERRVHESVLSDRVMVLATGNRREDKSAATTLPAHFRNSVCLMEIEPELEEWCTWYSAQIGLEPGVAGYLRYKSEYLSKAPNEADARGAFPTPRTWEKLGRMYATAQAHGCGLEVASGLVGEGAAIEFVAFMNTRASLVDPGLVLADPEKALPTPKATLDTPDKVYALMSGIGERAAIWAREPLKAKNAPLQFMRATGWSTVGNREYIAVAVSTYLAYGGLINDLVHVGNKNGNDALVRATIQFLKDAYK